VAPVPGNVKGDWVMGSITRLPSGFIKLQVSSTDDTISGVLGKQILVGVPKSTPTYFGGRYDAHRKLAVGDALVAIIVPGAKHYVAHEIDDLGR
jgi:hypothetical protein